MTPPGIARLAKSNAGDLACLLQFSGATHPARGGRNLAVRPVWKVSEGVMTTENLDVFNLFTENYSRVKQEAMSLRDYLLACRDDPMLYATDFSILIYPVISMKPGVTHMGSHDRLLGEKPSRELEIEYSNELQIDKNTPPAFMVHAFDDHSVPIDNSLRYMQRLREFDIECEMHLYKKGGHGFGMLPGYTDTWPPLMVNWIKDLK